MSYQPFKIFRRDADTSAVTDGQADQLSTNPTGRLKVSVQPGAYDAVTGTITSATSVVSADVARAGAATVFVSGTYAGVNFVIEVSNDGTTWVAIPFQPISLTNTQLVATGVLTANATVAYDVSPILGPSFLRVRATAWTSGTANISIARAAMPVEYATQVNGTVAVSGTVTTALTTTTVGGSATVVGHTPNYTNALTNTKVVVKAAAGRVYGWDFYNPNTTDVFVQVWNALTANVTVGTTAPLYSIRVPAQSGRDLNMTIPQSFATGIIIAATTTWNGATAPTTALDARVDFI